MEAEPDNKPVPEPQRGPAAQQIPDTVRDVGQSKTPPSSGSVKVHDLPTKLGPMDGMPSRPIVPGYEILHELGRGGMGIVYKAQQAACNRLVALKVIRPDVLGDPIAVARFLREAQVAASLAHANIVHLYEAGSTNEQPFLVFEYVEGFTLQRLLAKFVSLPLDLACDFVRQAALGLQHAFERGLVHRDIKPANLILAVPSETLTRLESAPPAQPGSVAPLPREGVVKILDLGLARLHKPTQLASSTSLTGEGAVLGTPDYIAPEQAEDPASADIRSDLYSLGCTFYHMLTGRVPFPGGTLLQKLDKHRWATPLSLEWLRPEVPAELAAVITKLIAKNPVERFQTPADLVGALAQCPLPSERISPSAPDPPESTPNPVTPFAVLSDIGPGRRRPSPAARTRPSMTPAGVVSEVRRFRGHLDWVQCVAFSPDGRLAVSGGLDHVIRLWEVDTGLELRRCEGHTGGVLSVRFSPDGNYLLSGSGDQSVRLWAAPGGQELRRLLGHRELVTRVAFSSNGRRFFSASGDRTVRIWKAPGGQELGCFLGHKGGVSDLAVSPDGHRLLTGGRDGLLRLWDIKTRRELRALAPQGARPSVLVITSVDFSPNGRWAVTGNSDRTLALWDLVAGRESLRLEGHSDAVTSVAFSPNGQRILSGSLDGTLRLWDVANRCELYRFEGHTNGVTQVMFSPDEVFALSSSADETVRLWRVPAG